jgi:hypothetical protein
VEHGLEDGLQAGVADFFYHARGRAVLGAGHAVSFVRREALIDTAGVNGVVVRPDLLVEVGFGASRVAKSLIERFRFTIPPRALD